MLIGLKLTPIATSNRHTSYIDDLSYRLLHLEELPMKYDFRLLEDRVRRLENEREKDRRTIKGLQDEISSRKRRRNESGDYADEKLEEEARKCRHLGTREEPIVLELRGEEICLRTGHVKSSHSR